MTRQTTLPRAALLGLGLAALAVLATGCVRVETDFIINSETSVEVEQSTYLRLSGEYGEEMECDELRMELQDEFYDQFGEDIRVRVKHATQGGMPGCVASYEVDPTNGRIDMGFQVTKSGRDLVFTMDNRGLATATGAMNELFAAEGVNFDELMDVDFVDAYGEMLGLEGRELEEFREEMRPELSISVTFPGKVTSASHNGHISGNTVTWDGPLWENISNLGGVITATGRTNAGAGSFLPSFSDVAATAGEILTSRPVIMGGLGVLTLVGAGGAFLLAGANPRIAVSRQKPAVATFTALAAVGAIGLGGTAIAPLFSGTDDATLLVVDYPERPEVGWEYSLPQDVAVALNSGYVGHETVILAPTVNYYYSDYDEIGDLWPSDLPPELHGVTALDTRTGAPKWHLDISSELRTDELLSFARVIEIPGSKNFLLLSMFDGYYPTMDLSVVNGSNGSIVSHIEIDHIYSLPAESIIPLIEIVGDTVVLGTFEYDYDHTPTMHGYRLNNLAAGPAWSHDLDSHYYEIKAVRDSHVLMLRGNAGTLIDVADGRVPQWAQTYNDDDSSFFESVQEVDGYFIRAEGDYSFFEIQGINAKGEKTWNRSIDAEWMRIVDGMLLISNDDNHWSIANGAMRIDPRTGENMWPSKLRGDFRELHATTPTHMYVTDDRNRLLAINVATGEVDSQTRLTGEYGYYSSFPGKNLLYLMDSEELLAAYPAGSEVMWKMRLRESEVVVQLGNRLGTYDLERNRLTVY